MDSAIPPERYEARVERMIELATEQPFDRRQPVDASHMAAQTILADFGDRRGIGRALNDVPDDVRIEITDIIAAIVRKVMSPTS
jgi:hypothetical protein